MSDVLNENNISGGTVHGAGNISGNVSRSNSVNGGDVSRDIGYVKSSQLVEMTESDIDEIFDEVFGTNG